MLHDTLNVKLGENVYEERFVDRLSRETCSMHPTKYRTLRYKNKNAAHRYSKIALLYS